MPSCVFKHCNSCSQNDKKDDGVSFHKFPTDADIRDEWIAIVRRSRGDENWMPSKFCVVCCLHFDESDIYFTEKARRLLKKTAKPTRYLAKSSSTAEGAPGTSDEDRADQTMEKPIFIDIPAIKKERDSSPESSEVATHIKIERMSDDEMSNRIEDPDSSEMFICEDVPGIKKEKDSPPPSAQPSQETHEPTSSSPQMDASAAQPPDDELDLRDSDLDSVFDSPTDKKLKKQLKKTKFLERRIQTYLETVEQLKKRKEYLSDMLRDKNMVKDNVIASELVSNLLAIQSGKKKKIQYSPAFKEFAITLHSLSPGAYECVRETFDGCLPHHRTLRREPGFSQKDKDDYDYDD